MTGISFARSRCSPIISVHKELDAEFFVWNQMLIPKSYGHGVTREHFAIRQSAGLTDMSGIKKIWVEGTAAQEVLSFTITRDCRKIHPGSAAYAALLDENGYLVEDVIVFHLTPQECERYRASWLICFGAGFGVDYFVKSMNGKQVEARIDDNTACLMLQGPDAEKLLTNAVLATAPASTPAQLKRFEHGLFSIQKSEVMIARTSYSGEDGFEIFAGPEDAKRVWKILVALGAMPVGFDAIDVARIEAGLLFFGKDMTGAETPMELGLDFVVDFSKQNFRGKDALQKKAQKPRFKTVGLALDGVTPFFGRASVWMSGVSAGSVSSYAVSEWLGKTVAIAQIKPEFATNGREIYVLDDGCFANEGRKGVVCARQFYTNV